MIKKIFSLSLFFALCSLFCYSQQGYSTKKKAIKNYEEGVKYLQGGNSEAAKEYFDKAIKEDENFMEAHMSLAYVLGDTRQYEKAISEIKKAININPDFFSGNFYLLAQLEMKLARYKDAKEHFEKFMSM